MSQETKTSAPISEKPAKYKREFGLSVSHGNWVMFEMETREAMKKIVKVIVAIAALAVLTNAAPGNSWAVACRHLTSAQTSTDPKPRPKPKLPTVNPGKTKEGKRR